MDFLKKKLLDLDLILVENSAPIVQLLNPGLSKDEILSFLQKNNIKSHPKLVTLYEWHNAVRTVYGHFDYEVDLIPLGAFFNLEEMVQMRKIFYEWAEKDFDDLDNYVPFMGSGESDMFVLNLLTGEILVYKPMIQIIGELAFHSIDALIDCILECFSSEAYKVDPQKGILIDIDKYQTIQKNLLKLGKPHASESSA